MLSPPSELGLLKVRSKLRLLLLIAAGEPVLSNNPCLSL